MRTRLFGLPEWIICKQSLLCRRKWWARSWSWSSSVSPFSFSIWASLDFPIPNLCTAQAFPLNGCLISARVYVELFPRFRQNFNAHSPLDPWQHCIRPDTRLPIRERKKSARPIIWVKCCAFSSAEHRS
jgi:hypothetical protein